MRVISSVKGGSIVPSRTGFVHQSVQTKTGKGIGKVGQSLEKPVEVVKVVSDAIQKIPEFDKARELFSAIQLKKPKKIRL